MTLFNDFHWSSFHVFYLFCIQTRQCLSFCLCVYTRREFDIELEWGGEIVSIFHLLSRCSNTISKRTYSSILSTWLLTNATIVIIVNLRPAVVMFLCPRGSVAGQHIQGAPQNGIWMTVLNEVSLRSSPLLWLVSWLLPSAHQIFLWRRPLTVLQRILSWKIS